MRPAHKILLLGANGQLGQQLHGALQQLGEVNALTRAVADLSHPASFRQVLLGLGETFHPTVVVNAAAYTAVDQAEAHPHVAHAVNAESVGVLAELAQTWGAMLVHYSSDYVFDGAGHRAWQETDIPHPLSVYGASKLAGEQAAAFYCAKHLVLRTSWVVGVPGANFLKTMLDLAAQRDSLRVVADQVGAPTSTVFLADVTVELIQAMQSAPDDDARWGIYHLAAAGETSWQAYAQHVIAGAIARGATLKTTPNQIYPIASADYPRPAPRPANSRLNTQKIQTRFGVQPPAWQVGVDAILDQLISRKTP